MKSTAYTVEIIPIEKKLEMEERYLSQIRYEIKAEIYGCCIKLLTGSRTVADRWGENFYLMSQNIRSHGRLYVVEDPDQGKDRVYYDSLSRTAFLINMDYYGWIKSLALSLAGDVLEDEHGIYSVHGACLDVEGRGVVLLGGSGAGKTTHTYGLIRDPRVRVVADDWFFGRIYGPDLLGYGSEKNFYIRSDLSSIWKEFQWLVEHSEKDSRGREVIDIRWVIGKGRILPLTTLYQVIILNRGDGPGGASTLDPTQAMKILEENGFYNPHFLVKDNFKDELRKKFFRALLGRAGIHQVNTSGPPEENQRLIRDIAGLE